MFCLVWPVVQSQRHFIYNSMKENSLIWETKTGRTFSMFFLIKIAQVRNRLSKLLQIFPLLLFQRSERSQWVLNLSTKQAVLNGASFYGRTLCNSWQPTSMSHSLPAQSRAVMMTSLALACYFHQCETTVATWWRISTGRAKKHLTHMIGHELPHCGEQTGLLGR